jgi:hypothetical protein
MALVQTVDLEVVVDGTISPPLVSTWVAAHNPMYLEWIRKDTLVTDTQGTGLPSYITFTVADNSSFSPGDLIYANTTAVNGVFEVDSLSGSNEIVTKTLGGVVAGTHPGYINNLTTRKNYYAEIELIQPTTTTQLALLQATPDTTGKVGIDISGAMQSYLSNEDPIDQFILDGYKDQNASKSFRYRIKEVWDGSSNSFGTISDKQFAVNGAFQIGHEENGNYAKYYLESNIKQALWLKDFDELTAWVGYDIDVAFIYPDTLTTIVDPLQTLIEYYNYNDVIIDNVIDQVITTADENNIIRWKLPVIEEAGTPLEKVKYFLLFLFDDNGNVVSQLKCNVVPVKDTPCPGIYLQWLGEKGNRSYFLFNDLYNESMQVEGSGTYSKAFDRIDTLTEVSDWFNKDAYKKIQLGAEGLTRDQINGLKTLLKSPKVFEVDPVTFKKVGVLVEPGSFNIGRGDDNTFRVEFTMVYPKQFGQSA